MASGLWSWSLTGEYADEDEHDVEHEDDYGNPDESHSQKTLSPCAVALAVVSFDSYRRWLGTDSPETADRARREARLLG